MKGIREARAEHAAAVTPEEKAAAKSKYIEALDKYFDIDYSSYNFSGYRYVAPNYRPDGILDAMDVALFMSKWRNLEAEAAATGRQLRPAGNRSQRLANAKARLLAETPDFNPNFVSNLPGKWRLADKNVLLSRLEANTRKSKGTLRMYGVDVDNLSPEELKALNELTQLQSINALGSSSAKATFRELVDDRGNIVRIYSSARGGSPEASADEIRTTAAALQKIRDRVGSDKKPITVSLIAPSSMLISGHDASREGSSTLGFAFKGGDAHVFVKRHRNNRSVTREYGKEYSPENSWHSTAYANDEQALEHTVIHEYAHVVMYKYWSSEDNPLDNGSASLASDYRKFGVNGQQVSRYGQKNFNEHFAEAYTRYIITGDATPEFLDLLRSKGLLKSQQKD